MDQKLPLETDDRETERAMAYRGNYAVTALVALCPLRVRDIGPALEAALAAAFATAAARGDVVLVATLSNAC